MEKTFETLKKLQEILSEKYTVEREIRDIPKALETKKAILSRLQKTYIEKNQQFELKKAEIKHLNFQMTEAEQNREAFEKRMDVIKTQREYEALDKEIRDATEEEQRLRRDIQRSNRELEEMQVSLEREEQMIKMQEEEVSTENEKINEETNTRKIQLEKLNKSEKAITPGMDENILFKFQRILKNKSGAGIVAVKSNVCSGCHMILPAQFVNDVRGGDEIQFCPYCSRILFWEQSDDTYAETEEVIYDAEIGGLADLVEMGDDL